MSDVPLVPLDDVAAVVPRPGSHTWGARPAKIHKKMTAAAAKVTTVMPVVNKTTAHVACLTAMRELASAKLSGADKKAVVIDQFLHTAEHAFRNVFPDQAAFAGFVGKMVDDTYAVLGKKTFGRSGCC